MIEIKNAQVAREESWVNGGEERTKWEQQQEQEELNRIQQTIEEMTIYTIQKIEEQILKGYNTAYIEFWASEFTGKTFQEQENAIEQVKILFEQKGYNITLHIYSKSWQHKSNKTGYFNIVW